MQKKFNTILAVATITLVIFIIIAKLFLPLVYSPSLLPFALLLVFSLSFFGFRIFQRLINQSPKKFAGYYMAFAFGKMIIHLFIMLTLAFINRKQAIPLIIWYGFFFLIYTVIETIFTFKISKKI
jgi:phosphatidylglycerophosphate synthase